jgi:hypothetical protein
MIHPRQAATAMRDLSANPDYKRRCADDGGIKAMIILTRHPVEQLQALAFAGLRHLSVEESLKGPIVKQVKKINKFVYSISSALLNCFLLVIYLFSVLIWLVYMDIDFCNPHVVILEIKHHHHQAGLRQVVRCAPSGSEDIQLQCAGLLANLSEMVANQVPIVDEGGGIVLVGLASSQNEEIQQDTARALANLCSNEHLHVTLYRQGALTSIVKLIVSTLDITQRYAAMALRFISVGPEVRISIVQDDKLEPFIRLASSDMLEYRRASAVAMASFVLHESNKHLMVKAGCIPSLHALAGMYLCV